MSIADGVTIPDVSGMTCKQAAHAYLDAGDGLLLPVPWFVGKDKETGKPSKVPIGMKGRSYASYQVTRSAIDGWRPSNRVGLVTSRASGLLVLDLDEPAAFRLWRIARGLTLPPTAYSVTGRAGGGIHLLFDARDLPADLWPRKQREIWPGENFGELKSAGWIAVEPSKHPSGAAYRWERREILPLGNDLLALLAERAKLLGAAGTASSGPGETEGWAEHGLPEPGSARQHFAMLKITTKLVRENRLSDAEIVTHCMGLAAISKQDPADPWRPEVILRDYVLGAHDEIARSDKAAAAADDDPDDLPVVTLSKKKQESKIVNITVPAPGDPMAVARAFVKRSLRRGVSTLISWRGDFYRWDGSQWNEADIKIIRDEIYHWLEFARYWKPRATKTQPDLKPALEPWAPSVVTVNRVADALAAVVAVPWDTEPGTWLDLTGLRFTNQGKPDFVAETDEAVLAGPRSGLLSLSTPVIALTGCLLDIKTRILHPASPSYFVQSSITFPDAYQVRASLGPARTIDFDCPDWKHFLKSVWPDDVDSIRLLRQWFGYAVSGDTSRQKIMMLVGPKRSGKGTIARVLRALMTPRNVANPTAESLKDRFGMSSLIGKSLAIVGDARFEGHGIQTVIERLLSVSGEDAIDIDRKNRPIWNGRLGTRFMILTNKVPELRDSSGAIASRFLTVQLTSSWIGKEDLSLEDRLMAELPGILFWALDGMFELEEEGFTVPGASDEAQKAMEQLSSPHASFVDEMCEEGPDQEVTCEELYDAWKKWCKKNSYLPGNSAQFGRDLRSASPAISRHRARDGDERPWKYHGISFDNPLPVKGDMRVKSDIDLENADE